MFGASRAQRGARTEETIEVLRRAWTGRRFSFEGQTLRYDRVKVTPPPAQSGRTADPARRLRPQGRGQGGPARRRLRHRRDRRRRGPHQPRARRRGRERRRPRPERPDRRAAAERVRVARRRPVAVDPRRSRAPARDVRGVGGRRGHPRARPARTRGAVRGGPSTLDAGRTTRGGGSGPALDDPSRRGSATSTWSCGCTTRGWISTPRRGRSSSSPPRSCRCSRPADRQLRRVVHRPPVTTPAGHARHRPRRARRPKALRPPHRPDRPGTRSPRRAAQASATGVTATRSRPRPAPVGSTPRTVLADSARGSRPLHRGGTGRRRRAGRRRIGVRVDTPPGRDPSAPGST